MRQVARSSRKDTSVACRRAAARPPAARAPHAAAGSSRRQQAAAGGSRQQEAAAGGKRRQQKHGDCNRLGRSRRQQAAAGSSLRDGLQDVASHCIPKDCVASCMRDSGRRQDGGCVTILVTSGRSNTLKKNWGPPAHSTALALPSPALHCTCACFFLCRLAYRNSKVAHANHPAAH